MLRPGLQPTLEERSVVDRQVHGEADGRRGKRSEEQPALPVVECAGRPEDEEDKEEDPEQSLNDRLPVEPVHTDTRPDDYRRHSTSTLCGIFGGRFRPSARIAEQFGRSCPDRDLLPQAGATNENLPSL